MEDPRTMVVSIKEGESIIIHDDGDKLVTVTLRKSATTSRLEVTYDKAEVDVDRAKVYGRKFPEDEESV